MLPEIIGAVRFSVRDETFRLSFAEPFRVIFAGTLLALEVLCIAAGAGREFWLTLGFVPTVTGMLSAAAVVVLICRYKFSVGPEGLACYDFWCRPMTTRWNDMGNVTPIRFPGLAYVRVTTSDHCRALWLPLFVSNPGGLQELVRVHAGPDHPLSELLGRELGD